MRILLVSVLTLLPLTACNWNDSKSMEIQDKTKVKFATFNVSFAHDGLPTENYQQWVKFMNMPTQQQELLIIKWHNNQLDDNQKRLAERVMQIRNVAAIIQKVRPDVLFLNEFNNEGYGKDDQALTGFQQNYLGVSQSLNSVDGGELQTPIEYPFVQNYATNTGLPSAMDFNQNGYDKSDPNDAFGFGFYHGHYAFALMSKFKINTQDTRTFQTFKRKDLPGAKLPKINVCSESKPLPTPMKCGDNWFDENTWAKLRLSSKNHVDVPISISTNSGIKTVNLFLSHPTPPAFDTFTDNNKYRNSAENEFWKHYLDQLSTLYDDNGVKGGFTGESFVILGDLNADFSWGTTTNPEFNGIQKLLTHRKVNQSVVHPESEFVPVSKGALEENNRRDHPFPQTRTSTFGSRADYAVPSADLKVIDSGVFWQSQGESGRLLFNDKRIGKWGNGKEISSDHRLVWVTVEL